MKHTDFWQHRMSLKTNDIFSRNGCWYILRCVQSCLKVWLNGILALFTWLLRSYVLFSFWSSAKVELVYSFLQCLSLICLEIEDYYWWYIYPSVKPWEILPFLRKKAGIFCLDCSLPLKYISNQMTNKTWSICCEMIPAFLLLIISPLVFLCANYFCISQKRNEIKK